MLNSGWLLWGVDLLNRADVVKDRLTGRAGVSKVEIFYTTPIQF